MKNSAQKSLFGRNAIATSADVDKIRRIRSICFRAGVLKNDDGMRLAFRALNRIYLTAKSEQQAK